MSCACHNSNLQHSICECVDCKKERSRFKVASNLRLRLLIYIAGPMALGAMADNIKMAWDAAERLRDAGFTPICPQDTFFGAISGKRRPHAEWLDIDRPLVLASAAVLRLPGESRGADQETQWAADANIPVFDAIEKIIRHFCKHEHDALTPAGAKVCVVCNSYMW